MIVIPVLSMAAFEVQLHPGLMQLKILFGWWAKLRL